MEPSCASWKLLFSSTELWYCYWWPVVFVSYKVNSCIPLVVMMTEPLRTPKTVPIIDDYEISNTVLGLGINGKVVQCYSKATREKYALKVGWMIVYVKPLLAWCHEIKLSLSSLDLTVWLVLLYNLMWSACSRIVCLCHSSQRTKCGFSCKWQFHNFLIYLLDVSGSAWQCESSPWGGLALESKWLPTHCKHYRCVWKHL